MTAGVLGGQQHSLRCPLSYSAKLQAPAGALQLRKLVHLRQQLPARASDSAHLQRGLSIFQQTARQQTFPRSRRQVVSPAAISADAGIPVVASQQAGAEPVHSRGLGSLTSRILSGSVLGLAGGLIILAGGWVFTVATCLVAYQATQEFYGFITSKVLCPGMFRMYTKGKNTRYPVLLQMSTALLHACPCVIMLSSFSRHGRRSSASICKHLLAYYCNLVHTIPEAIFVRRFMHASLGDQSRNCNALLQELCNPRQRTMSVNSQHSCFAGDQRWHGAATSCSQRADQSDVRLSVSMDIRLSWSLYSCTSCVLFCAAISAAALSEAAQILTAGIVCIWPVLLW